MQEVLLHVLFKTAVNCTDINCTDVNCTDVNCTAAIRTSIYYTPKMESTIELLTINSANILRYFNRNINYN